MKSGWGGASANITPLNPMRNIGMRKSWKVGKRITVLRSVSSSFAANAFMNRCGHIINPTALTMMNVE